MLIRILLIFLFYTSNSYAHEKAKTYVLDGRALQLGDGKISTTPKRGNVYSCMTRFGGGGALKAGPWIHGSTWDETQKITVYGNVAWPNAHFSVDNQYGKRNLIGNALPVGHTTGIFPIQSNDPAFQIDRNPNAIQEQQVMLSLPLSPSLSGNAECVPMGMIGVALNGVAIFNALDGEGRDAVAHEVQDHCNGHPERNGQYHYHGPSKCLQGAMENNRLVGYALDGFGIYSLFDENGRELTNADLDECHGRVSKVEWDGKMVSMYHYVLTREYPYTVGCFRGVPIQTRGHQQPPQQFNQMPPRGNRRQPPPEAIQACSGQGEGASCQFISPRGDSIRGVCRRIGEVVACAPNVRPGPGE